MGFTFTTSVENIFNDNLTLGGFLSKYCIPRRQSTRLSIVAGGVLHEYNPFDEMVVISPNLLKQEVMEVQQECSNHYETHYVITITPSDEPEETPISDESEENQEPVKTKTVKSAIADILLRGRRGRISIREPRYGYEIDFTYDGSTLSTPICKEILSQTVNTVQRDLRQFYMRERDDFIIELE